MIVNIQHVINLAFDGGNACSLGFIAMTAATP
jgi:hypothetical protein